ncbi:dehydrogenase/reductase SDR family member 11-like [Littorina saxatilis]|uniref:Dehydrogenase/reductase SDR family member 11 n=1 Tax=Littorina saxatilis TaxID=31220 RepID=A0AAN9GLX3_9CAEN
MAERWRGRVALVTGASAGIGYCMAKALVQRGMKVVACARNIAPIQELAKELSDQSGSLTAIKCDVSKEEEVAAMFQAIRKDPNLGRMDVCINNAGLAHNAPLLSGEASQWKNMFEVNVLGLLMCSKEAFQLMRDSGVDDGHIILVNSMSGIRTVKSKGSHCYVATKFAVTAIREGIRNELREMKSKIRISQVCPGYVETEFVQRHHNEELAKAVYSSMKCLQPEDIRDAILYILDAPPHVEVNDVHMRATEQDF